ncbi:MAG: alkylation repair protein [Agromyces sp.]|nr:alkylation repair protein [Agromyces sp.]
MGDVTGAGDRSDAAHARPGDAPVEAATAAAVRAALAEYASPERAAGSARYFKTGPGEYGEGDRFIGSTLPTTRAIVARFAHLPLGELDELLASDVHEHRMTALLIMVRQFEVASPPRTRDDATRTTLHEAYLRAVRGGRVNNWDLVDLSAPVLVGEFLLRSGHGDDPLLDELVASASLWERRVGVLAGAHSSDSSTSTPRGCRARCSRTRPSTSPPTNGPPTARCADPALGAARSRTR